MYSLIGLAVVTFSYAIIWSQSGMTRANALGEAVSVEETLPSANSIISTTYSPFVIYFSGEMDETTLTTDTVKVSYVSEEVTTYVTGAVAYDSTEHAVTFTPAEALPTETALTLELTAEVLDLYDNAVGPYSIQFTSNTEEDVTAPSVTTQYPTDSSTNADTWTSYIYIYFDESLNPLTIDGSIWSSNVELVATDTYYDSYLKAIVIQLEATDTLTPNTSYEITFDGSAIIDTSGNPLGDDYILNFTTASENATDYNWSDPANQMWNPRYVWLDASLAGLTTKYHFSFPITESMDDGYKIAIVFPAGFDIGDASASGFWENNDINNWNDGTVSIESVSVNEISNTATLTLNSDMEFGGDNENIYFTLGGIVNSLTPSSSYTLSFTTKDTAGATIEGPNDFNPISIIAAGDGVATITVLESGSEDPIEGVTVYFNNYMIGTQNVVTDENGEASISGIPAQEWGTYVYAWIDGSNAPDGYKPNWTSQNIYLTTESPEGSATIYLDAANLRITGTISHEGVGEDGETKVNLWASGASWTNKTITLDDDGSTDYTLYLADPGYYSIGLDRYYDPMGGGYSANSTFIPPASVQRNLTSSNTEGNPLEVDFTIEVADKTIRINVMDQFDEAIPNAWCSVSSDYAMVNYGMNADEDAMSGTAVGGGVESFWAGAQSNSSGVCNVNVKEGKYMVNASIPGIPGKMGMSVKVEDDDEVVEVDFVIKRPTIAISGNVSDENGAGIHYANINCYDNSNWSNAYDMTDSDGDFIFYVSEGTWTCNAWAPNIGFVPAAEGVDVTNFEVTENISDLNFAYDPDAFANITGTIENSEGEPLAYTWIWADKINTTTNQYSGYGNGSSTDGNGAFSIKVPKNDSDETYKVNMWDQSFGQFILSDDADASEGDVALGVVSLPETHDVTISVNAIPGDQYYAYINIQNTDTQSWSWAGISLTDGDGSDTIQLPDGTYTAHTWIPGFGENKENFSVNGENTTVDFDFSNIVFTTYNVTVTDTNGVVENAYVEAFDPVNGAHVNSFTDSEGEATLTVYLDTDSAYMIKANAYSHVSSMVTAQADITDYEITLVSADSSISGTVTDSEDDEVPYAWIDAMSTDGSSWVGGMSNGSGDFTINVPSSTIWNVTAHSPEGTHGTASNVAAGDSDVALVLDQTLDYFIPSDPVSVSVNPTEINSVSSENADLSIPAGALGTDTNGVILNIEKTAAVAETETTNPLGNYGIDITASDSNGSDITSLDDEVNLEIKIDKEQLAALLANGVITIDQLNAPLGYFNETSGAWVIVDGSSVTVEVQEEEGGDYETISIEDFITDYESTYAAYNDYIVSYTANTNHFTIFAPVVGDIEEDEGDDDVGGDDVGDDDVGDDDVGDNPGGGGSGSILDNQNEEDEMDEVEEENAENAEDAEDDIDTAENEKINDSKDYANHWAKDYIQELFDRSLVSGCENNNFCPNKNITRGELVKIAMNVYGVAVEENLPNMFTDIDKHWAKDLILTANKLDITSGYEDKTFKPDTQITRSEALKILFKASTLAINTGYTQSDNPFVDVKKYSWYFDYVMTAYKHDILKGYKEGNLTYFKPNQQIKRAEIAKLALMMEDIVNALNEPITESPIESAIDLGNVPAE